MRPANQRQIETVAQGMPLTASARMHPSFLTHLPNGKSMRTSLAMRMHGGARKRFASLLRHKVISSRARYRLEEQLPRVALLKWHHAATAFALIART